MRLASAQGWTYNSGEPPESGPPMKLHRRMLQLVVLTPALALFVAWSPAQQTDDKETKTKDSDKRPKVTLKAQPMISMSPSKVTLRAELVGGSNDFEDFYCATVEWDWGDGTQSESKTDCEPYQRGKSEIKRRFTVDHIFRAGYYQVAFRLKQRDKAVASATTTVQVQAGLDELRR
jgi:hypothetical protein